MEISSTSTQTDQSAASGAQQKLTKDFDHFLTILTTQLQNQDPLSPMDSNEFTNQLVNFSSVEQAIATNKNLEQLIGLQTTSLVGYLGNYAEVNSPATQLVEGEAKWFYTVEGQTKTTQILVLDQSDKVVYVDSGETKTGKHEFVWNGEDNQGNPLPDGTYKLQVAGFDSDGKEVTTGVTAFGKISSVETNDGAQKISIGGTPVSLSDIISVKAPTSH